MTNITAKIIADSISTVGKRITTFELEYPRFIHAEFMTHRMISKNAASSRAIPVKAMLDNIRSNPAMPSHWGKNEAGMQASEECNEFVVWGDAEFTREVAWKAQMSDTLKLAQCFAKAGYHKQIVNRLTEPFQMIKVVATATEWDNFFWLRKHKDAQPEIRILAEKMWEAREVSIPVVLSSGQWHLPYVDFVQEVVYEEEDGTPLGPIQYFIGDLLTGKDYRNLTLEEAIKVSASMCAQVSYRKADDTLEKALLVYDRLVESKPVHASPFEHQATPVDTNGHDWEQEGVTAFHKKLGVMSGNFAGWIQNRQLIEDHTCYNYQPEQKETN